MWNGISFVLYLTLVVSGYVSARIGAYLFSILEILVPYESFFLDS
jgi:hypothetical protein